MGNSAISPFKKKQRNKTFFKQNINNRIISNYNTNITKNSIRIINSKSPNIKKNNNKELEYNENNNKPNVYFFGYHQKSNKNIKKNPIRINLNKSFSQTKIINNFKKYAFFFLPKNNIIQSYNEDKKNNDYMYKSQYYIKKYKNEDKFYRYGKKSNTIKSNNINTNEKKKFNSTEISKDKDRINRLINNNKNNANSNKKNKHVKNEKSSQFVLLNNSFNKNLFNSFHEINNEKNNNFTIVGDNKKISNEIRLTTIKEQKINDNITYNYNITGNYDNLDIENYNISQNSTIKYNNYNNTYTSFIYNKPQLLLEQLNGYIDDDDDDTNNIENYKNNKEKKDFNLTDINNNANISIYTSKILDNLSYKYIGNIFNNKKEGIGKVIYKKKYILISSFENNEINGPIIISDSNRNIFKGYINNNKFGGYCNLNFNFSKKTINNKVNSRKKNDNNFLINNEGDDIIKILYNYNKLFDFYLYITDSQYNYSYIETYISDNNINDVGIIKWTNNAIYIGEIKNKLRDGIGMFKWPDGSRYEGEFIQNRIEGWGEIYFIDGNIYKGKICNGLPHGYGEFIWNNDTRYIGNYINGQKEGFGIYIMNSSNLREQLSFFGFWKNGKQDGYGIIIKNKKINYVKYKEGKRIKTYKYDLFIREILSINDSIYRQLLIYDVKSMRKIINNIIY